ncbi:MAG: hypothetical protein KatS3mg131_1347 [Candidatus Tectimicrobiota bacterium]|nr:MAG: hypothetical protein KatS3mg131_1347 [Candidatus Tectomicrobia bacterium]
MTTRNTAVAERRAWGPEPRGLWLRSPEWDLGFLTFSGALVVLPLMLYELAGNSAIFVNLFIAGVIGGPHMYATFFRTALDPAFRTRHPAVVWSSLFIPAAVVLLALWHFQLLLTLFFFWASLHVLHQIAYLMECYQRKQPTPQPRWARLVDYAVVFSSLYPFATYKFIHDQFYIGHTPLLYPEALKTPLVFYAISGVFAVALVLFLGKTAVEIWRGTAHYPKILLILTTVVLAFVVTSFSGRRLEIAFQGFNTWHSFQYLALTWYLTRLRLVQGPLPVPGLQGLEKRGFAYFYGLNLGLTVGALVLIGVLVGLSGLPFERSYYIVVLSFLLVHYYHDHILFTEYDALARPTA